MKIPKIKITPGMVAGAVAMKTVEIPTVLGLHHVYKKHKDGKELKEGGQPMEEKIASYKESIYKEAKVLSAKQRATIVGLGAIPGAMIGGGTGAVAGYTHSNDHKVKGALKGAGVGALAGGAIGGAGGFAFSRPELKERLALKANAAERKANITTPRQASKIFEAKIHKAKTQNEVNSAYKNAAKKYHPDTNKSPEAEDKMRDIARAFSNLKGSKWYKKLPSNINNIAKGTIAGAAVGTAVNIDHTRLKELNSGQEKKASYEELGYAGRRIGEFGVGAIPGAIIGNKTTKRKTKKETEDHIKGRRIGNTIIGAVLGGTVTLGVNSHMVGKNLNKEYRANRLERDMAHSKEFWNRMSKINEDGRKRREGWANVAGNQSDAEFTRNLISSKARKNFEDAEVSKAEPNYNGVAKKSDKFFGGLRTSRVAKSQEAEADRRMGDHRRFATEVFDADFDFSKTKKYHIDEDEFKKTPEYKSAYKAKLDKEEADKRTSDGWRKQWEDYFNGSKSGTGTSASVDHSKVKDAFETDLSKATKKAEVQSAYKKAAMKYHPDRNKAQGAQEKMKNINSTMDDVKKSDWYQKLAFYIEQYDMEKDAATKIQKLYNAGKLSAEGIEKAFEENKHVHGLNDSINNKAKNTVSKIKTMSMKKYKKLEGNVNNNRMVRNNAPIDTRRIMKHQGHENGRVVGELNKQLVDRHKVKFSKNDSLVNGNTIYSHDLKTNNILNMNIELPDHKAYSTNDIGLKASMPNANKRKIGKEIRSATAAHEISGEAVAVSKQSKAMKDLDWHDEDSADTFEIGTHANPDVLLTEAKHSRRLSPQTKDFLHKVNVSNDSGIDLHGKPLNEGELMNVLKARANGEDLHSPKVIKSLGERYTDKKPPTKKERAGMFLHMGVINGKNSPQDIVKLFHSYDNTPFYRSGIKRP